MTARLSHLTPARIEAHLLEYTDATQPSTGRSPTARYASFDYCFNYFQAFRDAESISLISSPQNVQHSCLQLGFYLASWGMLRGSSTLLQRSAKSLEPLIASLASTPSPLWDIDANSYTDENIEALLTLASRLRGLLPGGASDTLVTKVMLGVFGSVPAFDTYFKNGLRVATFGRKSLHTIAGFYADFAQIIDKYRVPTIDFISGRPTERRYSRAKVIDMIFFMEGLNPI